MNFTIFRGDEFLVHDEVHDKGQSMAISTPQRRRRSLNIQYWIYLATLPILLVGMPARSIERPLPTAPTPLIISSFARITVSSGEISLFPTPVSARGEEDDKCIWLGICN